MADMNDILLFWDLRENPFSDKVQDTSFFYPSTQHREAINVVVIGVKDLNIEIALIVGDIGAGKTFTVRTISGLLSEKYNFSCIFVPTSFATYGELLCNIVERARGWQTANPIEANQWFDQYLREHYEQGRQVVLFLDESQGYSVEALDQIRQLVNKNGDYRNKVLALVLVGQNELTLKIKALPQLRSRIRVRHSFNNLSREEVPKYILFRLWKASNQAELRGKAAFLAEARAEDELKMSPFYPFIDEIYRATGGQPRAINFLCSNILSLATELQEKPLTAKTVRAAIKDFENILL